MLSADSSYELSWNCSDMKCELINPGTLIGGVSADNKRHQSDFYETPAECTEALIDYLGADRLRLYGSVWEPACGDGAMTDVFSRHGIPWDGGDIRKTKITLGGTDFLEQHKAPEGTGYIITNPPFSLAYEFIEHARAFGIPFAMILKSSFWNVKKNKRLFEETRPSTVLPFTWRPAMAPERGRSPTMEFMWTLWGRSPSATCLFKPLGKPSISY